MRVSEYPMTPVVARRSLDYRPKRGPGGKVTVEIGRPARDPGGADWYCPWRIAGLGHERRFAAFGVDQMQALILCLAGVSSEVTLWGEKDPDLMWMGSRHLGLDVHWMLTDARGRPKIPKGKRHPR